MTGPGRTVLHEEADEYQRCPECDHRWSDHTEDGCGQAPDCRCTQGVQRAWAQSRVGMDPSWGCRGCTGTCCTGWGSEPCVCDDPAMSDDALLALSDPATDHASRPTSASPSGASPVAESGRGSSPTWCDGTPHSPTAIPPLPLHDWRWMGDDPYTECARCGRITDHDGRVIAEGRATALASGGAE